MKAINILVKLAAIAALSLALVACESDPCKDSAERCLNGATCDGIDGACICAAGYEGDSCSVVSRNKFLGTGGVTAIVSGGEACTVGTDSYSVTITPSSSVDKVVVSNIYNASYTFTADVDGDQFTASNVTLSTTATLTSAVGTTNAARDSIFITYSISSTTGTSNTCTFKGKKQ